MAVGQRTRDHVFGLRQRVAAPLMPTHGTLCQRMPRFLSMLLAATSFACAPQRIDAVSCETGGCPEAAAGAASGGGFGGSGGSAGTASAGNPAVGRDSL